MLSLWLRYELPALEVTKIQGRIPALYTRRDLLHYLLK